MEGCGKPDKGPDGYCSKHLMRFLRHGDPSVVIGYAERSYPKRGLHPNWTGDDATYSAVHLRLRNQRGSASLRPCVDCGGTAKHWSYTHNGGIRERQSEYGPYSISMEDYVPRCVRCHKRHDLGRVPMRGRPFDVQDAVRQYTGGSGIGRIASKWGVSRVRVRSALVDAGIVIRRPGGVRLRGVKTVEGFD